MKVKSFNPETIPQGTRQGVAKIAMNRKSGTFSFPKAAAERLNMKTGTKVEFFQDEENEDEWYIAVTDKGFPVREKKDGYYIFNSSFLIAKIFDSMSYINHTGFCLIGSEPKIEKKIEYWPVITASLKND